MGRCLRHRETVYENQVEFIRANIGLAIWPGSSRIAWATLVSGVSTEVLAHAEGRATGEQRMCPRWTAVEIQGPQLRIGRHRDEAWRRRKHVAAHDQVVRALQHRRIQIQIGWC